MIPSYTPYFPKGSLDYAHDAINSTWISSHGKYLPLVKNKLEKLNQVNHVVLTNTGTAANHLIANAVKFKYPNIENLIVPSNVYVAAWNMFISNPKFKLIPVDSNLDTWNPDLEEIQKIYKKYKKNTAFLAVHNLGNIIPVSKIKKMCPGWIIIEDNAQGFGGKYNDKMAGSNSFASSVSFYGNKTITSGEGGMFCTNDLEIYEYANDARSHFVTDEKFIFGDLGYNYRMTNVQAAILLGQLDLFEEIQYKKLQIFKQYKKELCSIEKIKFQQKDPETEHANWMFGFRIENGTKKEMDNLKFQLMENNIESRPMFPPINYHHHLTEYGNYPVSKKLYETAILLPSFPDLVLKEIIYICDLIKKIIK